MEDGRQEMPTHLTAIGVGWEGRATPRLKGEKAAKTQRAEPVNARGNFPYEEP
jgi:hypothetical protein